MSEYAVWKYVLGPGISRIPMPMNPQFLSAGVQDGRAICAWAMVWTNGVLCDRYIGVFATGELLPADATAQRHVGRVTIGPMEFHVFDLGVNPP